MKKKLSLQKTTIRTLTGAQLNGIGGGIISFANPCQPSYGPSGTHYECPTARCYEK
jgi:hypothetical protein